MKKLFTAIFLLLLTVALHYPTAKHGFVLDDTIHIEKNTQIRSLENVEEILLAPLYPGNLYRPAVILSYLATYHYYELDPYYYHLTNILLHACSVALVFFLFSFFFTPSFSFFIGLLFATHPITSEVVANISGRAELMAAVFGLLSLLFFLAGDSKKLPSIITLPLGAAFFGIALLSKESALAIPLLYILIRTYYGHRNYIASAALPLISFAILIPIYLYMRFEYLDIQTIAIPYIDNPLAHMSNSDRVGKAILLLGKYLSLLFFPIQMSADYSYAHLTPEIISISSNQWYVASFLIALVGLSGVSYLGKRDDIPFFSMWFLLSFIVTSNIIFPIGTIFGERLAYLPSIGFSGLLVTLCFTLSRTSLKNIFLIALAITFSFQTYMAEKKWESNETLFIEQMKISPDSVRVKYNYGIYLRNKGKFQEAKKQFEEVLELFSSYTEAAYGMATIEVHEQNVETGKQWLLQSLQMNPHYIPSYTMLGRIMIVENKIEQAKEYFYEAYKRSKRNEEGLLGLFAVALQENDLQMAALWEKRLHALPSSHREYYRLKKSFIELRNAEKQ